MRHCNRRRFLAAAMAILPLAAALLGQEARSVNSPQYHTGTGICTDVRRVDLHTTVIDKSGHLVTTLPQSAFTVYENGVKQQVRKFMREDVPVSMGLVVDNSGSMRLKRSAVGWIDEKAV